jgi:hypothetical protein
MMRTKGAGYLVAAIGISAGLFVVFESQDGVAASEAVTTPVVAAQDPEGCELWCLNEGEGDCDENEHFAYEPLAVPGFKRAGGPHNNPPCWEGSCQSKHGECTPEIEGFTSADLEMLRSSVADNDVMRTKAIMGRHQSIAINATRSALQVKNCVGEVFVHMPVPASFLVALADSTNVASPPAAEGKAHLDPSQD